MRFSDVDVYRHVNNVKYFEYLQESRLRLMADLDPRRRAVQRPPIVVAQTDVDYRAPIAAAPASPTTCGPSVVAVGIRSMTIESEIGDGERCWRAPG